MHSPKAAKGDARPVSDGGKAAKKPSKESDTEVPVKKAGGKRVVRRQKHADSRESSAPVSRKASIAALATVSEDSKAPSQQVATPSTPPQQTQAAEVSTTNLAAAAGSPTAAHAAEKVTLDHIAEDAFKGSTTRPSLEDKASTQALPGAEPSQLRNDAAAEVRATPNGSPTRQPRRPALSRKSTPNSAAPLKPGASEVGGPSPTTEAGASARVAVNQSAQGQGAPTTEGVKSEAQDTDEAGGGSTTSKQDGNALQKPENRLSPVGGVSSGTAGPASLPPTAQPSERTDCGAGDDVVRRTTQESVSKASREAPIVQTTREIERPKSSKAQYAQGFKAKASSSQEAKTPSHSPSHKVNVQASANLHPAERAVSSTVEKDTKTTVAAGHASESQSVEQMKPSESSTPSQTSAAEAPTILKSGEDRSKEGASTPHSGTAASDLCATKIAASEDPEYPSLAEAAMRPKSSRRSPPHKGTKSESSKAPATYSAVTKQQPKKMSATTDALSLSLHDEVHTSTTVGLNTLMQPWEPEPKARTIIPAIPTVKLSVKAARPQLKQATAKQADKTSKPADNSSEMDVSQSSTAAAKEEPETFAASRGKQEDPPPPNVEPPAIAEDANSPAQEKMSPPTLKPVETTTSVQTKRGRSGLQVATTSPTRSTSRGPRTDPERSPLLESGQSSATLTEGMAAEQLGPNEAAPAVSTHKKSMRKKKKKKTRSPLPSASEIATMIEAKQASPAKETATKEEGAPDPPSTRYGLKAGDVRAESLSSRFETQKTTEFDQWKRENAELLCNPEGKADFLNLRIHDPQIWKRYFEAHPHLRAGKERTSSERHILEHMERQMEEQLGPVESARIKASLSPAGEQAQAAEAGSSRYGLQAGDVEPEVLPLGIKSGNATDSPSRYGSTQKFSREKLNDLRNFYSKRLEKQSGRARSPTKEESGHLLDKLFDRARASQEDQKTSDKSSTTSLAEPVTVNTATTFEAARSRVAAKGDSDEDASSPKTLEDYVSRVGGMKPGTKMAVNSEELGEFLRKQQAAEADTPSATSTAVPSPEKRTLEETSSPKAGKKKTGKSKHKSRGKNTRTRKNDVEGSHETKDPEECIPPPTTAAERESSTSLADRTGVEGGCKDPESKPSSSEEATSRVTRIILLNKNSTSQHERSKSLTGTKSGFQPLFSARPSQAPSGDGPTRSSKMNLEMVGFRPTQPDRLGGHQSSSSGELTRDELKESYRRRDRQKQKNLMNIRRRNRSGRSRSPPNLRLRKSGESVKPEGKEHCDSEPDRYNDPEEAKSAGSGKDAARQSPDKATDANQTGSEGSLPLRDEIKGKRQGLTRIRMLLGVAGLIGALASAQVPPLEADQMPAPRKQLKRSRDDSPSKGRATARLDQRDASAQRNASKVNAQDHAMDPIKGLTPSSAPAFNRLASATSTRIPWKPRSPELPPLQTDHANENIFQPLRKDSIESIALPVYSPTREAAKTPRKVSDGSGGANGSSSPSTNDFYTPPTSAQFSVRVPSLATKLSDALAHPENVDNSQDMFPAYKTLPGEASGPTEDATFAEAIPTEEAAPAKAISAEASVISEEGPQLSVKTSALPKRASSPSKVVSPINMLSDDEFPSLQRRDSTISTASTATSLAGPSSTATTQKARFSDVIRTPPLSASDGRRGSFRRESSVQSPTSPVGLSSSCFP